MLNRIWTLWWQGESQAPEVVKKCIESMRLHANGAEVVVLDQISINTYIQLPDRIMILFQEANISITHLSDLIRVQLLYQYGGLWLDSTILVTEDIPRELFGREFYTIKNGTGGDRKNIARERWTAFLLGGQAQSPVFETMTRLFNKYWEINDELVCYYLIDFCMNEVYESDARCREIIDSVPNYAGNVFDLTNRFITAGDLGEMPAEGIFHKLSYKKSQHKGKVDKFKSLAHHTKELLDIKKWKKWGFQVAWATFLSNCTRSIQGCLGVKISQYYNKVVGGYWRNVGRQTE